MKILHQKGIKNILYIYASESYIIVESQFQWAKLELMNNDYVQVHFGENDPDYPEIEEVRIKVIL